MTRCRRPGPAPWWRRRRQRRCHHRRERQGRDDPEDHAPHRRERQGRDDPEDHAPAVANDFVVVVVIVGCVFKFFCFYWQGACYDTKFNEVT